MSVDDGGAWKGKFSHGFESMDDFPRSLGWRALRGNDPQVGLRRYDRVFVGSFAAMNPHMPPIPHPRPINLRWLGSRALSAWRAFHVDALFGARLDARPAAAASSAVWIHRQAAKENDPRGLQPREIRRLAREYADATNGDELLVVDTALMTVHKQAEVLSAARIVAGTEGAGFVTQLWMPPGGSICMVQLAPGSSWYKLGEVVAFQWVYGQYWCAACVSPGIVPCISPCISPASPIHIRGLTLAGEMRPCGL